MKNSTQVKTKVSFKGEIIYVGLDVHLKSWTVSILTSQSFHKRYNMKPDAKELAKYLNRNFPEGTYLSAYESGFCGFSVHRELECYGIENIVVHAADVPTTNKSRTQKNDGRDSLGVATALRGGLLEGIYVPTEIEGELKKLTRYRSDASKEESRMKNKIKSFLYNFGITLDEDVKTTWTKAHVQALKEINLKSQEGQFVLDGMLDDLKYWKDRKKKCHDFLKKLSKESKYANNVDLLTSIPGISIVTAMLVISELGPIDRFKTNDQLAAYVGFIPNQRSSGESERMGRLTNRGNKHLKTGIILSAWTFKSRDPAMLRYYDQLTKRMNANKAIIRIAKKLLSRIKFVLTKQQKYETGIVG